MAGSVGRDTPPIVLRLRGWADILTMQRAGLRLYQWLWVILCTLAALAAAAPSILSQPIVYQAAAETRFDVGRYGGLYVAEQPSPDFDIAKQDATEALRQRAFAEGDVRFGAPEYRVLYLPQEPGIVQVQGIAPTAAEAQRLADAGAEELARQVHAAGGREILRNMMGWELWQALQADGSAATDPFAALLREIIRLEAFPMSLPIRPVSTPRALSALSPEEQSDLARALESREDLWRAAINTRNARLNALCELPNLPANEYDTALQACAETNDAARWELTERNLEIERLAAIRAALTYAVEVEGLVFDADAPGAAFRIAAALPVAPEPRYIGPLLALAVVMGLVFGASGVLVDRAAGVAPKIQELWQYRELIINLVLRDLRSRYKGSALGYLWTQLAPLMLMLVFWLVFSTFFKSGIAMFPVFIIVALLPWNYCAEAVSGGARSVLDNANLIKKVFFPREVLPLVSVLSSLVNYLLSLPMMFLVIAVVQFFYEPLREQNQLFNFSWTFAYLPVLLIIQTIFLVGVAMFLSALSVFFRDAIHLIGVLIQFWFFLTPVIYTLEVVSAPVARVIRWLNPMASLVEFHREILYGAAGSVVAIGKIPTPGLPALDSILRVSVTAFLILAVGYWFFQRSSWRFGEEI
ncbi:MAG: ABC transporter permease [Chloroflexales bacterium]|nr:ABC transporter permease [Chloroflexales bacterium]